MTERGRFDDPVPDDPAAHERDRRRAEREARRGSEPQSPAEPVTPPPPADRARKQPPWQDLRLPGGLWRPGGGSFRRPAVLAALIAGLVAVVFLWALFQPFHGDGHGKVVVTIPKGTDVGKVADILNSKGVISNSTLFRLRVKLAGKSGDLQSGTFSLAYGMSYGAAIDALTTAPKVRTLTVTIPEGFSRAQAAPVVSRAGVQGNYEAATARSPLLDPRRYGAKSASRLEGFLFPATYDLKPGASAADLVGKQIEAFKQRIAGVPMAYARKKNLTTFDILTIASMIEREAGQAHDRPLVAAVIYNRLHAGMPLGIDATVRFATGNYTAPLKQSELDSSSPYNTRRVAGLPPGPIDSPGLASIEAAAHPAKVPYLFYVTKPGTCGGLAFATTAAKAAQDVARYNGAREAAGGNSPTTCPGG